MWPIIARFEVFGQPITIHSFGTFLVLAFLASAFFARWHASKSLGIDKERVFNICFVLFFLGLAGARLFYALIHHSEFVKEPMSFIRIWEGGLVFYGGLFTGLIILAWYLPSALKEKGWGLLDVLAVGLGLAIFVGRWASFLSGENYGEAAPNLPWGIAFPSVEGSAVPSDLRGIKLHPTQLYHSLHGLLLFIGLGLYLRKKPWAGRVSGAFLVLYAVGTAVIEIWRADDVARGMVIEGLVSVNQLICIPVFFLGVAIFLIRRAPEAHAGR